MCGRGPRGAGGARRELTPGPVFVGAGHRSECRVCRVQEMGAIAMRLETRGECGLRVWTMPYREGRRGDCASCGRVSVPGRALGGSRTRSVPLPVSALRSPQGTAVLGGSREPRRPTRELQLETWLVAWTWTRWSRTRAGPRPVDVVVAVGSRSRPSGPGASGLASGGRRRGLGPLFRIYERKRCK